MRVFYDLEFLENGKTIDALSIGMVAEDGRELYLQNTECHFRRADPWVKANVFPHLRYFDRKKYQPFLGPHDAPGARSVWMSHAGITESIKRFCDPAQYGPLELWGYYSSYDHVALCQFFGKMVDLPSGYPMWTNDLQQWAHQLGVDSLSLHVPQHQEHDSLADAQWNRDAYAWLAAKAQVAVLS
jgi:3' exoribonuclease, RNase T-like